MIQAEYGTDVGAADARAAGGEEVCSVHALSPYPAQSVEQDRGEDEQADKHAFKKTPDEAADLAQIYGDDQRVFELLSGFHAVFSMNELHEA